MMSVRILVGCRLSAVNQHDFVTALAANDDIELHVITESTNHRPVESLDQQRVYHYYPTWPVIFSRIHPHDKKIYRKVISEIDPDVLLSLAVSHLAFMGATVNFKPTVFLPQGGKINSSTRNRCRRRDFGPRWVMYRPLMWDLLNHVTEVWSAEPNREILSRLGMDKNKLRAFDWGTVDTELFRPKTDAVNLGSDDTVVIGSFRRIRNPPLIPSYKAFFDAIARLRKQGQDGFHVVLGGFYHDGTGEKVEKAIEKKIQNHDLEEYITRIDMIPKEEMPRYYSALDIYINLSPTGTIAGIGTASKEAMSCGCAFITFDDPPSDYVINHGQNGYRVEHENINNLAGCLQKLISNPELRESFSIAARKTAMSQFSGSVVAENVAEYSSVVVKNSEE